MSTVVCLLSCTQKVCNSLNLYLQGEIVKIQLKRSRQGPLLCNHISVENLWFANIIIGPAVLESIDPNQFGAIPISSTLHALISMMHLWVQTMDGTSSAVCVICSDYRKAFDLVDFCQKSQFKHSSRNCPLVANE